MEVCLAACGSLSYGYGPRLRLSTWTPSYGSGPRLRLGSWLSELRADACHTSATAGAPQRTSAFFPFPSLVRPLPSLDDELFGVWPSVLTGGIIYCRSWLSLELEKIITLSRWPRRTWQLEKRRARAGPPKKPAFSSWSIFGPCGRPASFKTDFPRPG